MKKIVTFINCVFCFLLFFSCEIGLGAAVDTEPPEVTIDSPDVDSIIRDTFLIHGTWSDDGEIDSVALTLSRTDGTNKVYGPFSASFATDTTNEKEGTWACVINPKAEDAEQIIDGTYEVQVAITDKGEHTSTLIRQVSIDNTAPLLILQRPTTDISDDDSNTYEYGQLFTLEGQVSDENNVHHIDIEVYSDSEFKVPLKTITVDNVSSTINIDIAKFSDGGAYTDIYGYSTIEAAEAANQLSALRYCKITTYDNAKRYPVEGNESVDDSHGNSTSEFYVYDDVNTTDLLGKYKINEIYKMQNGTYNLTDSSRAAEGETVLSKLSAKKKTASKFKLNPKNNPTFTVSGNPSTISNNSNIVIEVKPGLDGYTLQKDSLRPYILPCDAQGAVLVDDTSDNRIYLADAGDCEKNGSNYKFVTEFIQGSKAKNYETTHSENNMLLVNHYYYFGVEGSDIKNKSVISDGVTVFKFESNENSNRLTAQVSLDNATWSEINSNDLYIKDGSKIYIKGQAIGIDSTFSSLISVKVNNSADHIALTVNEAEKTMSEGYYTQPFTAVINSSDLGLVSGNEYSLNVSAGTPISDLSATIKFDSEPPVVSFGVPSPYEPIYKNVWEWNWAAGSAEEAAKAVTDGKRYLNKTATVNIAVSDNDSVASAVVEFQKQVGVDNNSEPIFETVPELTRSTTSNFSSWNVSFDTTKLNDNSLMRMLVTATDRSGNTTPASAGISTTYKVYQVSDEPSAVEGDSSVCLKSNPSASEKNKRSPGGSLSVILYDDDGVKTVKVELFNTDGVLQEAKTQTYEVPDSDITEKYYYTYKIDKTLGSGTYTLKFTVTDKYGFTKEMTAFPLKITAADPVVTILPQVNTVTTSAAASVIDPVTTVQNTIKVVSTGAPFKIERSVNGGTYQVVTVAGAASDWCFGTAQDNRGELRASDSSDYQFTDTFVPSSLTTSGSYKVKYKVTDIDGQTESGLHFGENETSFFIDNGAPTVTITTVPDKEAAATPTGTINGTATDGTDAYNSGLRKVQYKVVGDADSEIEDALETSSWNAILVYANHSALTSDGGSTWIEGPHKIAVRAIDNAGNIGSWVETADNQFIFDREAPAAAISGYIKNGETSPVNLTETQFYYGYKFSLSGTASDSYKLAGTSATSTSGTDCIKVYQTGITDPIATVSVADGKWTVGDLPRDPSNPTAFAAETAGSDTAKDGSYEYYVKVTDNVGKYTESSRITMIVDHTAPTFGIKDIGTKINGKEVISGTTKKFEIENQTDNFDGKTGSGIAAVYYSFTQAVPSPIPATLPAGVYKAEKEDALDVIKFLGTGTEADGDNLTEGSHTLYVTLTDRAGNRTDASKAFNVDQGRPEVSFTNNFSSDLKDGYYLNKAKGNSLILKGTVKESNKLVSLTITDSAATPNTIKAFTVGDGTGKDLPATLTKADNWTKEWTYTHSSIPEGKLKYQVTAYDEFGANLTKCEKEIFVDTVDPAIDNSKFNLPNVNNTQEEFFTFTGSAGCISETGSGIDKVEIGFSDSSATEPAVVASSTQAEVTSKTDGSWSSVVQFSLFDTFNTKGSKKLWVRATDKAGNTSSWTSSSAFTYDTAVPETTIKITKDEDEVSDLYRRKSYKVQGKATDDYAIKEIKLIAKDSNNTETTLKTISKEISDSATSVEWEWDSASDLIKLNADGEYTFTVTVTDWAELPETGKYKSESVSKSVIVDKTAPTITGILTTNSDSGTNQQKFVVSDGTKKDQTWYNTKTIKVKVTPSTDTTGIESVSYRTSAEGGWSDLARGTDNGTIIYTGSIQVANEGSNTVYFRVKDKAGNVNYENNSKYVVYNVDTAAPSIGQVYDELDNALKGEVYIDGAVHTDFVMLVADASDGDAEKSTGVKKLSVGSVDSDATLVNSKYKITIPYSNLDTLSSTGLNIVAYDYVNNTSTTTPFKLTVDSIAPEINVKTPALTDSVTAALNGEITITADVSDYLKTASKTAKRADGKLKKIDVLYSIDAASASDASANWYPIDSNDSLTPTTAKESIEIKHKFSAINKHLAVKADNTVLELVDDTSTTPAVQNVWVKITATDQANHTTSTIFKMVVDRNSDRPVIEFNNVTMGTNMSSTNYKWLLNTTLLQGSVTDDDGVQNIWLSLTGADDSWKEANLTGTNWNFDLQKFYGTSNTKTTEHSANGPKTIYFKVKDSDSVNTGTEFVSKGNTTDFDGIYLRHTENNTNKDYSILYVKPETLAPVVTITGAQITGEEKSTNYSTMYLGGTKKTFNVYFTATDENGISEVKVTAAFTKDDGTASSISAVTATTTGPDADGIYTAAFTSIPGMDTSGEAGTIEFTVSAKDTKDSERTTARESQDSKKIKYDFKKPTITFSAPSESSVNVGSISAYGEISETSKIEYALSLSGTTKPDGSTSITTWTGTKADETGTVASGTASLVPAYSDLSSMASSWYLYFDGDSLTQPDHNIKLLDFIKNAAVTRNSVVCNDANITNQTFTDVVDVYLWIRATDLRGNITESSHKIQVDSQGQRPEVSIAYPATANEIVANTVNIYGSATPAEEMEIAYVWLQLVSTTHTANIGTGTTDELKNIFTPASGRTYGTLTDDSKNMTVGIADLDYMAWAGFDVYNMKTYKTNKTKWVSGTSSVATGYSASDYGILIETNGSTGWSKKINTKSTGQVDGAFDSTGTNKVGIAVYAQDAEGHISKRATQYISFDAAKPIVSNIYLKNSDNSIVKEYEDDMWISGEWYLTFTATDNQEVKSVEIDGLTSETNYPVKSQVNSSADNKWECRYKISDSSSSGSINKNISVSDGDNTTTKAIKINIDNNPPAFDTAKDNFAKQVQNSNGYYSFGGTVTDSTTSNESGINYVVFYLTRDSKVYDVMYKNDNNATTTVNPTDHLPWMTSAISSAEANTITLSAENKYAHRGGLVKVKGTIYKITSVNGKVIGIDGNLETISSGENAYFAIANVVNNTVKESAGGTKETDSSKYAYGYGTPSLDDGDRMIEYLAKDGSWTAQINARNIPDGAIKLNCVVFDKAGNASALKTKDLYVSNNAPRIAGVTINTDLNGNDKFKNNDNEWESGEHITKYDAATISSGSVTGTSNSKNIYDPDENVQGKSVKNALSKTFTIGKASEGFTILKGRTEIIPEIVGGNGAITYDFSWKDKAGGTDSTEKLSGTNCATIITTGSTDYSAVTGSAINIQIGDLVKAGDTVNTSTGTAVTDTPHLLSITIKDSIAAKTNATDDDKSYQSAELKMYFGVDVVAEGKPTADIKDFYWNNSTDSSVYDTENKKKVGHIELPDDLPADFKATGASSELMDRDAKLSGTVFLTGTASDSGKITALWFHIDGMNLSETGIAEKTVDSVTYYRLAVDDDNVLTSKDSNLTLVNNYEAEKHTVKWTYKWNTENINGTAQTNVAVKVMAENQGTPKPATTGGTKVSIDGETMYGAATYNGNSTTTNIQVDVVPYITELVTTLSQSNPDNSSEYGRSALGSYPVFYYSNGSTQTDSIEVKGYNITADATINFENYTGATAVTAAMSGSKFTVPAKAESGNISVVVNGVESLNNKNEDDACGSYDSTKLSEKKRGTYTQYVNYYNRQPNNINNDNLTDDVSLSIWDLNASAISVTSDLTRPVMHINPTDGSLGFAYSTGSYFYMPDEDNQSVHWSTAWNAFNSIGFTYDSKGNTFGVEMGTDSNKTVSSKFRILASVWGTAGSHEYGNYHALRLESHHGNASRYDTHPKLAATNPDNNNANVYLLYYDPEPDNPTDNTTYGDKLKLRCGKIPLSALSSEGDPGDYPAQNKTDQFGDFYDDAWRHSNNNPSGATLPYNPTDYAHCAVVVDKYSENYKPGKEYSMAVVPGGTITNVSTDTLVIAWVDPVNHSLVYGYLNDPITNNHKNKAGNTVNTATPNNLWNFKAFDAGYVDGACSITTDKAGGVHIAYYSTKQNGSLNYVYIPTPSGTAQTCVVDSYGATGKNVTIDFAYDSTSKKYIPYIGYYNSMKKPKYAYLYDTASGASTGDWKPKAGSNSSDYFTGAWECMFIPTVSSVDATDGVQIGVYRDSDGKKSKNPIIGYANGKSNFETAQLK